MEETALRVENITKIYPGVRALDNVSFEVKKGQIHALMGENGAGKSTLIKVIAGAIEANSGSIVIDGKKYEKLNPGLASSLGIGVIYQELNNVPSLSVAENVFLGKKANDGIFVDKKLMHERSRQIFEKLGVKIPVGELQPGDVVMYGGHVGVYIGDNMMINARGTYNREKGTSKGSVTINYISKALEKKNKPNDGE